VVWVNNLSGEDEFLAVKDRFDFLTTYAVFYILCSIARVPIKIIRVGNKFAEPSSSLSVPDEFHSLRV
jgi:hypothetical protein